MYDLILRYSLLDASSLNEKINLNNNNNNAVFARGGDERPVSRSGREIEKKKNIYIYI